MSAALASKLRSGDSKADAVEFTDSKQDDSEKSKGDEENKGKKGGKKAPAKGVSLIMFLF